MVFVWTSIMLWELHSLDITSTLLQGNNIEREVFVQLPSEIMEEGKIWKLQKCIYGLNDAPRARYNRVEQELLKLGGGKTSMTKQCFRGAMKMELFVEFRWFVYCGTLNWHKNVVEKLICIFKINNREKESFICIGLNFVEMSKEVIVDQSSYIISLKLVELSRERALQEYAGM